MDKHLEILAKVHVETRFFKLNAEKAPFFSAKLRVWQLPTLALFRSGVSVHSIIGFAELANKDNFKTKTLERLLKKYGVCEDPLRQISSGSEDSDEDK
ncbi:hypothetical protein, conserved [Eimeria tenella]|uniref:Thioredoxin domain-containing protein n=1 Tax=Eimeria tenella TaxID=5802 RepID=U6KK77_EIMTE|nr:hypothetical protein, conserved [Eimeria tenella]CDJ38415.1 hypothetical protein, conserved [Eimeria tenella]|eukprot:XP_013229253.1 hypothetical protein, conserved [Eimeria tenella]